MVRCLPLGSQWLTNMFYHSKEIYALKKSSPITTCVMHAAIILSVNTSRLTQSGNKQLPEIMLIQMWVTIGHPYTTVRQPDWYHACWNMPASIIRTSADMALSVQDLHILVFSDFQLPVLSWFKKMTQNVIHIYVCYMNSSCERSVFQAGNLIYLFSPSSCWKPRS